MLSVGEKMIKMEQNEGKCALCDNIQTLEKSGCYLWNCLECGKGVCNECINDSDSSALDIPKGMDIPTWFCEQCRVEVFKVQIL